MTCTCDRSQFYEAPPWAPQNDLEWLETSLNVQSMQFMIDMLPTLHSLVQDWRSQEPIRVLDVGTASGAGAHLLASLYAGRFMGPRMQVDAVELEFNLERYAKAVFPRINYMVGDVLKMTAERPWDLVLCSHTIEHVKDLFPFIARAQSLSRRWAVFYAPWKEEKLIPGHLHRIDEELLATLGPMHHVIIESPAWQHPYDPQGRCVLFVLPGTAAE